MHAEIVKRLEEASGPALVLDGEIWCAVNGYEFVMWDGAGCVYRDPNAPKWDRGIKHVAARDVRPYSASTEAVVSLINHRLPNGYRASGRTSVYPGMIPGSSPHKFWAEVGGWGAPSRSTHDVEPIALLIALFRSLQEKDR